MDWSRIPIRRIAKEVAEEGAQVEVGAILGRITFIIYLGMNHQYLIGMMGMANRSLDKELLAWRMGLVSSVGRWACIVFVVSSLSVLDECGSCNGQED